MSELSNPQDGDRQPTLEEQLRELNHIAAQTRKLLQQSTPQLGQQCEQNLDRLSAMLARLEKQVASPDEVGRDNLLVLAEIGQLLNSSLDLDEVLCIVMDTIVRLTGAERGFLMLRDTTGELVIPIARNWEQESIEPAEHAISRTIVNRVISSGKSVLTTNAREDPRFQTQDSIILHNLRAILCVPLTVKDKITGVIYADNRVRAGIFTQSELKLLTTLANQAAVAIENARLFESVRHTLAEVTELKVLMDNVFTSIASGVITVDGDDHITLCNRATQDILGCARSELIDRPIREALPEIYNSIARAMHVVRQTQHSYVGLELTPNIPGRGRITLSLNLSPLKDANQGVAVVIDDLTEKRRLEAEHRLFERMVSPAVINQLDPEKLKLGGKRTIITTLFTDISGYTSLGERLEPEELVAVLNKYLAAAANAVLHYEGTIDKFIGDGIMAWFNAPIPQSDHTLRAIQAALDIRQAVGELQIQQPSNLKISFGAGVHTGEAVLGLVGTEKRMEYTAIGDSVNTAKRIQENAAPGQILISGEAYQLVAKRVQVRQVQAFLPKGKRQAMTVYEVLGLK
jgi:adenylate cyclase